jgi:polysaccharide biosynthesis/export protein
MKSMSYIAFALGALIASSGTIIAQVPVTPSATPPVNSELIAQLENEQYRIGFQDTLEVQVFRHPDLNQRVSVRANGTISLFRLEEPIVAVCKTERELAKEIAAAYKKDYLRNPEVNVVVADQKSQSYAVIGAVQKPGNYFINRPVRLLELLAFAGGQTEDAGSRILVARTGSTSSCSAFRDINADADIPLLDFKLKDVLELKENLVLRPGDIVSVMVADIVYVYGNVNKQGQVEMKEPLTLTQAIASAEGLKPASDKDSVRVMRQKPGSLEREELVYSLKDINQRKIQDPYLEPNDVVAVGEDRVKSIMNNIGRSLTNGLPSIFYRVP